MRMIFLISALFLCGCASQPKAVRLPEPPTISTAYAGGKMMLAWEAEAGETYTVYYTDTPHGTRPKWESLPQATNILGQGQQVLISDQVSKDSARRYLLMTGDRKPY